MDEVQKAGQKRASIGYMIIIRMSTKNLWGALKPYNETGRDIGKRFGRAIDQRIHGHGRFAEPKFVEVGGPFCMYSRKEGFARTGVNEGKRRTGKQNGKMEACRALGIDTTGEIKSTKVKVR